MAAVHVRPEEPENGRATVRSVQRTGLSSLAVTLPKSWTQTFNVRSGSLIRFQDLGEGRLEVSLAGQLPDGDSRTLTLDASDCAPSLVARLLVGAYITGQDRIVITSSQEFPRLLRDEVGRIAQHVLGMSLIEDEPSRLEVQVFLDPTKHRLPSLLDRVVRMVRMEVDLCQRALRQGETGPLRQVTQVEEEIDRFYLLIARQILLASNDFQVARDIGVPSHHYQLGYRVVVKMLEVAGDLLATVAGSLDQDLPRGTDAQEIVDQLGEFDTILMGTMSAFREASAAEAHGALTQIEGWSQREQKLSASLIGRSRDKLGAARLQRILSSLGTAMEMLEVVNEITINRSVEPETVARNGGHPLLVRASVGS